jgi:glycine/D-amino acid oxidase-like deaminating enzyme
MQDVESAAMNRTAEVVVIGAGAFGASVAYHLAAMGQRNVVLLDRFEFASQTSPRAAGLTQQIRQVPEMTRLAMRAVAKIVRFSEETGEPLVYFQSGSVKIARTEEDLPQIGEEIADGRALGLDIAPLDEEGLRELTPFARSEGIRGMWFTASDLYLEPVQIPRGYATAAGKRGATLLPHTPVTAILRDGDRVTGVETSAGPISTPVVVDCAGGWARTVAKTAGISLPIQPIRHQLMITEPLANVSTTQPICRVIDANVYIRPEANGLMLGGYETDPLLLDPAEQGKGFQIAEMPVDSAPLRRLADMVKAQFPIFQTAPVKLVRGGLPTMTADGNHIVGSVPGLDGFFTASGCCVGGLSIAPAAGEALAELILTGRSTLPLDVLDIRRFGPELDSDEAIRAAGLHAYTHHYATPKRAGVHLAH